jgi:hypothetical protein
MKLIIIGPNTVIDPNGKLRAIMKIPHHNVTSPK